MDAAAVGDTVLVAPGVYEERVRIYHELVLLSEMGPEVTTIDARGLGTVVTTVPPAERVTIEGFRITDGYGGSWFAGGIHIGLDFQLGGGLATIRNNIIEHNNSLGQRAAGVYAGSGSTVDGNLIQYNNNQLGSSGDIAALEADSYITRNVIRHNGAAGGLFIAFIVVTDYFGPPGVFADNVFVDNAIAGIGALSITGNGAVRNNTIVDNNDYAWQRVVGFSSREGFEFTDNIVVHGSGIGVTCNFVDGPPPVFGCNNVWGDGPSWVGDCGDQTGINGNISEDPFFCNPDGGDYRIRPDSPCAPLHSPPGCGLIGALPVCVPSSVAPSTGAPPTVLRLFVRPNPVLSTAGFVFDHPAPTGTLEIYNATGHLVESFVFRNKSALSWDASVPSGAYFARLMTQQGRSVVKFLVVK